MHPPPSDPCSLHDEWLQRIENHLAQPGVDHEKLVSLMLSLVTSLRSHERERVARILGQI